MTQRNGRPPGTNRGTGPQRDAAKASDAFTVAQNGDVDVDAGGLCPPRLGAVTGFPSQGTDSRVRADDVVMTQAARRIALHHRLVRMRRWSRELDRLLSPPDPWEFSESICWDDHALGWAERDARGRELAA